LSGGDTVIVANQMGQELARGIVRYSSYDLRRLIGRQSHEIEAILGYAYGAAAVHRNDLILR
jgi:glutamate 5-kinase